MTDSPFYVFLSRYSFSALAVCLVVTTAFHMELHVGSKSDDTFLHS